MAGSLSKPFARMNIGEGKISYTLTEELGSGAFGTVYKALKKGDNRQVFAIKKIVNDPKKVEDEIKCCLKLSDHDHVVKYHGRVNSAGQTTDAYWLILEYCSLGTLSSYILSHECDSKLLLEFSENMSSGLKFLHKNKIVHRDLKTDNVLVTTNTRGLPICKISDFGLAACMVDLSGFYLTSFVGIPFFTAPEVWTLKYTESADIFSLGLILLAMFTRSKLRGRGSYVLIPFIEINSIEQPIAIAVNFNRQADVNTMIKSNFRYFEAMGNLIVYTINKEPKARPSASVLHDQIKKIQIGQASRTVANALLTAFSVARCVDELFKPVNIDFGGGVRKITKQSLQQDSGVVDVDSPFLLDVHMSD